MYPATRRRTDRRPKPSPGSLRCRLTAGEKARFLKLLQAKEAEAVSLSNKVSSLEAMVAELEGKYSELFGENGELMKQLETLDTTGSSQSTRLALKSCRLQFRLVRYFGVALLLNQLSFP